MSYLTAEEFALIEAEHFADQITDKVNDLIRLAARAGFALEITSVAGLLSVAHVRRLSAVEKKVYP